MNGHGQGLCGKVLLVAALAVGTESTATAAERDEAAAREYVYCGRVIAAWETISERGGNAMRGSFAMAATLRSDTEFLKQEIQNSSLRFKQRFPGHDVPTENRDLESEGDRCAALWKSEVQPLLGLR